MSTLSVLAPLGIGILAWSISGVTISSNMQQKQQSKLVARITGTFAGLVIGLVCLLIAIVAFGMSDDSTTFSTDKAQTSNVKTINIGLDTLSNRIDDNLAKLGSKFKVQFETEKLDGNSTSKYMFNDNNGIVVTADNSNGFITGIVVVTQGDNTMMGGFNMLHVVLSTISATLGDNELKEGKSSDIIMGLIKNKYPNQEVIVNNIRYSMLSTKDGVLTFFINPQ